MNTKVFPIRSCIACRQSGVKRTLLRFVRTPDGILYDATGRLNGRGAYVCQSVTCLNEVIKKSLLQKVLKTTMPESTLQNINDLAKESGGKDG